MVELDIATRFRHCGSWEEGSLGCRWLSPFSYVAGMEIRGRDNDVSGLSLQIAFHRKDATSEARFES